MDVTSSVGRSKRLRTSDFLHPAKSGARDGEKNSTSRGPSKRLMESRKLLCPAGVLSALEMLETVQVQYCHATSVDTYQSAR